MDWAAKLFGLNEIFHIASGKGGGVMMVSTTASKYQPDQLMHFLIQTTASEAALTALVAARARFLSKNGDVPLGDLVIYGTTQTHGMVTKNAMILGLRFRALPVMREDNYSLRGDTLKAAIEEDHKKGLRPFALGKSQLSWPIFFSHECSQDSSCDDWNDIFRGDR